MNRNPPKSPVFAVATAIIALMLNSCATLPYQIDEYPQEEDDTPIEERIIQQTLTGVWYLSRTCLVNMRYQDPKCNSYSVDDSPHIITFLEDGSAISTRWDKEGFKHVNTSSYSIRIEQDSEGQTVTLIGSGFGALNLDESSGAVITLRSTVRPDARNSYKYNKAS